MYLSFQVHLWSSVLWMLEEYKDMGQEVGLNLRMGPAFQSGGG